MRPFSWPAFIGIRSLLKKIDRLFTLDRNVALAIACAMFGVLATTDYRTSYEISLSTFYLLIVLLVSWNCGIRWGIFFAVLGFLAQTTVGLATGFPHSRPTYFFVGVGSRLFSYLTVVVLASQLRKLYDREKATARVDFLTGAANRLAFHEFLDRELARQRRTGGAFSVAYMDCDDFKSINDKFGHEQGDRLLRLVVKTMKRMLRRTDTVARLGGDEFAILLPDTAELVSLRILKKIREGLSECMTEHGWDVTFSIGIRTFNTPPQSVDEVLSSCDSLMYRVKGSGKSQLAHEEFRAGAK